MTQTDAACAHILACFDKVCAYLREENSFLEADDFSQVLQGLPRKQAAMQELQEALAAGGADKAAEGQKEAITPKLEKAVEHFNALATQNHTLLKKAVDVQSEIVGLILENVAQDQRAGYGASGHYAVNKEGSGVFTLSSDV